MESAPFMVRHKWLIPAVIATAILFVLGFLVRGLLEHQDSAGNAVDLAKIDALTATKTYSSFDKHTVLRVYNDDWATYQSDGKAYRAKCHFLGGNPLDCLTVIPGSYSGKHIWLEEIPGGLKQEDGGELHAGDAPLNTVVQQMSTIADQVQQYYLKNHSYPTTPEQLQAAISSSYMNPFTHKGDAARFYSTYSSSVSTSAAKLEQKTADGESWINETTIGPGEIHCCSLIYEDPSGHPSPTALEGTGVGATAAGAPLNSGVATNFFIRAGDGNGQFIPGMKPGVFFYIELSDGKSNVPVNLQNASELPRDYSKVHILVTKGFAEQSFFLFLAGAVPAILIMLIGGSWVMQNGLYDQKDQLSLARKPWSSGFYMLARLCSHCGC